MRHKASKNCLGLTSGVTISIVCSSHYCSEVQLVNTRDDEDFLTSEEACKRLNVSSRTLERYVRDGLLKKYRRRIGREVYYKRSEVEDLLRIRPVEDIEDQ
jgi:excisionase family DNA binding protein